MTISNIFEVSIPLDKTGDNENFSMKANNDVLIIDISYS